ncbi:MAG TPA: glycosyltransferase family 4 protein, partial [Thermoanaerobaculia bacterium]|nr:glycosyltransferase family 4 protein [Thermoanaerobaculia bacterium]
MRVLHLAAGNRWTGAAAPAFAEVAALREAGVDAHYAYVGGYKLEQKLARVDFAHPTIAKAQNPIAFIRTAAVLEKLIDHHRFDVVHAHLTYDHVLARFIAGREKLRTVRTFHSRRVIRGDPFTAALIRRTDALCVINSTLAEERPICRRFALFTPPPLDTTQFTPDGPDLRAAYHVDDGALLLAAIGKLDPARGFEDVLRAYVVVRKSIAGARLMIIGHGPHRPALETLARDLGVDPIWAGYHEDDLAAHYRAADVLLFTARGSDEGHRAVIESMGCGVVPATYRIDGMPAILGELGATSLAPSPTPESLAKTVVD